MKTQAFARTHIRRRPLPNEVLAMATLSFRLARLCALFAVLAVPARIRAADVPARPNILFIMSDDHAAHAMSCYGSVVNQTPNLDRIAKEGVRFDNCFVT